MTNEQKGLQMNIKNSPAAFVIPFLGINERSLVFLNETVQGILEQTDTNYQVVIIDDFSPYEGVKEYLLKLQAKYSNQLNVIFGDENKGPGVCRNIGVRWAYQRNYPIILFNDADDISHCRRLEIVRKKMAEESQASLVYSTFKVIDENGQFVSQANLTQSILEILEGHTNNPVQGNNAWIRIGTEKGYTNLTSATSVRTDLAFKYPFPPVRVSEDSHTWMRYSAGGGKYIYAPEIPTLYRIPQYSEGSSSRSREGGRHLFYVKKAETDTQGFMEALEIAIGSSRIERSQKDDLLIRFYIKLAETMAREKELILANEQIKKAITISKVKTGDYLFSKGLQHQSWL